MHHDHHHHEHSEATAATVAVLLIAAVLIIGMLIFVMRAYPPYGSKRTDTDIETPSSQYDIRNSLPDVSPPEARILYMEI